MDDVIELGLVIDGGVNVTTGRWIERRNPSVPTEIVGRVAEASALEVGLAVDAADRAFGPWAARAVEDRAALMLAAWERVVPEIEALGLVMTREMGKALPDGRGEIAFSGMVLADLVARAPALCATEVIDNERGRLEIHKEPYGPVAAVTPWNAPIILAMLKVAPALVTGNTMVLKPSPLAPLAVTRVLGLMASGLPDGVLNVVHGGAEAGRALTTDRRIRKIGFTGGIPTGARIAAVAAERIVPVILELGGNDPMIILDDAELDDAAILRAMMATFLTSGQVCMAAKRVYVHRSRIDEFVARYVALAAEHLVVGDPRDERVNLGPVATPEQRDGVNAMLADARARHATVTPLGTIADQATFDAGWFVRPTLVTNIVDSAPIVREEQFGPIIAILPFDDVDEVVSRANSSDVGLGSSVWSADEERAFEVARRLQCGVTFINTHNRTGMSLDAPFGGWRQSGYGREYADAGVSAYLQTHSINLPAAFRPGAVGGSGSAYPGTSEPGQ